MYTQNLAGWTYNLKESEIRRLLRVRTRYYMAGGLPGRLPVGIFSAILADLSEELTDTGIGTNDILSYGPTEGITELKEVLSKRMARTERVRGEVTISSGSQQTIYAVLKIIAEAGDVILAPEPTYLGFIGPCQILGIRIITVPMKDYGLPIEELSNAFNQSLTLYGKKPVAIYFPSFADNPSGHSPCWRNKQEVFEFAVSREIFILEDNAYKEIYFTESKAQPMKSLDRENETVVYMNTTSKEAAVLRIGYSIMPSKIQDAFVKLKGFMDLCTSSLTQTLAIHYYKSHIDKVLPEIRNHYRIQKESMLKSIDEFICCERSNPIGGFFIWADLGNIDSTSLLHQTVKNINLSFVPGSAFFTSNKKSGWVRFSYSSLDPTEISDGIQKLSMLL